MLSKFFLDRPVFAWVIAIVIMAAGGLAIFHMPVGQYPPIAPRGFGGNGGEYGHPDY